MRFAEVLLIKLTAQPVHSIAAALFLPAARLHQFNDIGARSGPQTALTSSQATDIIVRLHAALGQAR